MKRSITLFALVTTIACSSDPVVTDDTAATDTATPAAACPTVDPTDPEYDRFEAPETDNACVSDDDCFVGGCRSEICSAVFDAVSTCKDPDNPPTGTCGCVAQECVWSEACPA